MDRNARHDTLCEIPGAAKFSAVTHSPHPPPDWQDDWNAPTALHRPLPIEHGITNRPDWREYLVTLKNKGVGGIVTNVAWNESYLESPSDWGHLRDIVTTCREMGLRVWLYDEFGYPSGAAGGLVLKGHPEFEAQAMVDTGGDTNSSSRFQIRHAYEYTPAVNMGYRILRYVNLMDDRAIKRFIEVTHDAYARELGTDNMAHVEAFFTDEPSLVAFYTRLDPKRLGSATIIDPPDMTKPCLPCVPWVYDLPERYRERFDGDIMATLPSLFGGDSDTDKRIRRQFWELVGALVSDRYFGQIARWCASHGVSSTGHLLMEENVWPHIVLDGGAPACLRRMQIPGIDVLSSHPSWMKKESGWLTALQATSAALSKGTRLVMTETSDCAQEAGWEARRAADLRWIRAAVACQAALGVTEFTSYYRWQNLPDQDSADYADFIGRLNSILRDACPAPNVGLYYPIATLAEDFLPAAKDFGQVRYTERLSSIENAFHAEGRAMLEQHYAFAIVDREALESATIIDKQLVMGGLHCDSLMVTEATVLPDIPRLRAWLKEPGHLVKKTAELPTFCAPALQTLESSGDLLVGRFTRNGVTIRVVVNTSEEAYNGNLSFPSTGQLTAWYPETGKAVTLSVTPSGRAQLYLAGCETIILAQ